MPCRTLLLFILLTCPTAPLLADEVAPAPAAGAAVPAPAPAPAAAPAAKNPDPWQKFNRAIFRFNDKADEYLLKPVAKGYKAITPAPVRRGITNFFSNLREPITVLNDLLQGKMKQAGGDTVRFVINSTVGLVGIFDVAVHADLPRHDEDFGQTLGKWGVGPGPFLVLPFLGPSDIRDTAGLGVDFYSNPRRYYLDSDVDWALWGVDMINSRANLLDAESIIQGDRYLFIRDLYLQHRDYEVKDGKVDDPFLDDSGDDGSADGSGGAADAPAAAAPADAAAGPDAAAGATPSPDAGSDTAPVEAAAVPAAPVEAEPVPAPAGQP